MYKPAVFGVVVFLLLAAQGAPVSAQGGETPPLQMPAGVPDGPAALPPGWQEVMTEDFEGAWPGSGWDFRPLDDGPTPHWAPDDFKPYAGVFSAWPASGGNSGVDPEFNVYPDGMDTQMFYGPFDLSDAAAAQVEFWVWYEIETGFDYLSFGISSDDLVYNEQGSWDSTSEGWEPITFDLAPYLGDDSVWMRWDFFSDYSYEFAGPFIDNITVSKLSLAVPDVSISRSGSDIRLDWTADTNATGYEVWWGVNAPYFELGMEDCSTASNCATGTTPPHDHFNPVSTANNYTYVVRAVKGLSRSAPGNRVSEFDFALVR